MSTSMALERILHSQGFGSRKACRQLVRHRRVAVDGDLVEDPFREFDPEGLVFEVDSQPWTYRAQVYLMLNKPAGVECSRSPRHHSGVLDLLPEPLREREVQPVGRLDEDTTGLLLLSDDGQFIHRLTSPRHRVAKTYAVRCKHPVEAALVAALLAGVQLHDEPEPIAASACRQTDSHGLLLSLTSGKYHQVKRMVAAAGNRVEALRRVAIGGLSLPDDLAEGQWRWLDEADLALLRA